MAPKKQSTAEVSRSPQKNPMNLFWMGVQKNRRWIWGKPSLLPKGITDAKIWTGIKKHEQKF
jgi:hypothetical protein